MNNNKIYTIAKEKDGFLFMTYNIDQAMREEKYESTKWNIREPRVKKMIMEKNADIICLQELRSLPDANHTTQEFLSSFKDYRFSIAHRNSQSMSFGQAILYKNDKFFPISEEIFWLSNTPQIPSDDWSPGENKFGYVVFGMKFMHVEGGKIVKNAPPFWIFNTHFGLDEILKTNSCKVLTKEIPRIAGDLEYVISGDFNLFPDRDANKQRKILTETFFDLGKGAITSQHGVPIEGTFVGYDHDEFKADLKNMISRLDHVFGSKGVKYEKPTLCTETMIDGEEPEELITRNLPSDHLPIIGKITFPWMF